MYTSFIPASLLQPYGWLLFVLLNVLLSLVIALTAGKQRRPGILRSFILCCLITAPAGWIVLLLYPTKKQKQALYDLNARLTDPYTLEDHLLRLQVLKQSGVISKAEYKEEKQRLTASRTGETDPA